VLQSPIHSVRSVSSSEPSSRLGPAQCSPERPTARLGLSARSAAVACHRTCRFLLALAFVCLWPLALAAVVSAGATPAAAQECDPDVDDPPCDPPPPQDTEPPSVTITPSYGTFGTPTKTITIEWCDNDILSPNWSRVILLNGVDVTSNFNLVWGSRPGCNDFATSTGTLTFSLGGNTLEASIRDQSWNLGQSSAWYSVYDGYVIANAGFNNFDNQRAERCEVGCFTARYVHSTVPYFSMGVPRNVALVYDGDRAHPMPVVYVDVTGLTDDAPPVQEYWLEAKVNSAFRTFRNGEQRLRFAAHQPVRRFAGQIDVRDLQTGMHRLELILTVIYGSGPVTKTFSTKLPVVNENNSPIAKGWSVAGVQRLYKDNSDGSVLITEGDGSGVYFASCGPNCFSTPPGDFSRVVLNTADSTYVRSYVDSTKVLFDKNGFALSVTDRLGNVVGFKYDGSNRLWKIEDPYRTYNAGTLKSAMVLTYDANGLSRVDEPGPDGSPVGGRATTFTVDASRRLVAITDPDNVSTTFGYDGNLRLSTVTDRRGSTSTFVYDPLSWKLSQVLLPQIAIDAGGGATQLVTPTITYQPWQTVGVPTTPTASAPATPLPPDPTGRITDAENRVTSITVDRWGQPVSIRDPLGRTTTIGRNSDGLPLSVTRPTGVSDMMGYGGPLVTMVQPAGQSATYIRYGVAGQPDSIYGPGQRWVRLYLHEPTGRVESVKVEGVDSLARYSYDARNRLIQYEDHRKHRWIYRYDPRTGNPDSVHTSPAGHFRVTRFDGYGRDSAWLAEGALVERIVYDVLNRPREVYAGTMPTPTVIGYDSLFRTSVRDPKQQLYRYEYNALGWLTRQYDPTNASMSYRHDKSGLVRSWTNRRGQIVDYRYDAVGRLVSKRGTNVAGDSIWYSADDRQVRGMSSWSDDWTYFKANGQPDSTRIYLAGVAYRFKYRWSAKGMLDSLRIVTDGWAAFAQRRYFRPTGLLDSMKVNGQKIAFTYDKEFQRLTTTFPVGSPLVTRSEAYTNLHQRYRTSFNNAGIDAALWRNYLYDARGRLSEDNRKDAGTVKIRNFSYDHRGQLSGLNLFTSFNTLQCPPPAEGEDVSDGTNCVPVTNRQWDADYRFHYDSAGNLWEQREMFGGAVISGSHANGNRIQSWGAATYGHDADGNLTTKTVGGVTTTYEWDSDSRLVSVTKGGTTLRYDYNAFGQPVRRTRNGVADRHFLWEGDQLLAELDSLALERVAEYVYAPGIDNPVAIVTGRTAIAAIRFVQEDELGNVVGVFGSSVAQTLRYDVRGKLEAITGTLADTNRLRWKGLMWEGDVTQLYYVRNRWYDPETGRFMTEDPLGVNGGLNVYAFAGNDQINFGDPSGLTTQTHCRWIWVHGATVYVGGEPVAHLPGYWIYVCEEGPGPPGGDGGEDDQGGGGGGRGGRGGAGPQDADTDPCEAYTSSGTVRSICRTVHGPGADPDNYCTARCLADQWIEAEQSKGGPLGLGEILKYVFFDHPPCYKSCTYTKLEFVVDFLTNAGGRPVEYDPRLCVRVGGDFCRRQ
jgi:RHS repeat-associated protein